MKIYNFSSGPSQIPIEILKTAKKSIENYKNTGFSILSLNHRSKEFLSIVKSTEKDLRELLKIPKNYHVFFMQGGATAQFSIIPLNLLHKNTFAEYIITGHWSKKSFDFAKQYGNIFIAEQGINAARNLNWKVSKNCAYVHYTINETADGIECRNDPIDHPRLVCDFSSTILSKCIRIEKYALIYASIQKNIGIPGLCLVIIRNDMIKKRVLHSIPPLYNYSFYLKNPIPNTPPIFSWFICHLILKWIKKRGGLSVFEKENLKKIQLLYTFIDNSRFYINRIPIDCRSRTNIIFHINVQKLEKIFLIESKKIGLIGLSKHSSQKSGIRIGIYNSMPISGVKYLIHFMKFFEKKYKKFY